MINRAYPDNTPAALFDETHCDLRIPVIGIAARAVAIEGLYAKLDEVEHSHSALTGMFLQSL
jgi:hypothetical protein